MDKSKKLFVVSLTFLAITLVVVTIFVRRAHTHTSAPTAKSPENTRGGLSAQLQSPIKQVSDTTSKPNIKVRGFATLTIKIKPDFLNKTAKLLIENFYDTKLSAEYPMGKPNKIPLTASGKLTLLVVADGFDDFEKEVSFSPNEKKTLNVKLSPRKDVDDRIDYFTGSYLQGLFELAYSAKQEKWSKKETRKLWEKDKKEMIERLAEFYQAKAYKEGWSKKRLKKEWAKKLKEMEVEMQQILKEAGISIK